MIKVNLFIPESNQGNGAPLCQIHKQKSTPRRPLRVLEAQPFQPMNFTIEEMAVVPLIILIYVEYIVFTGEGLQEYALDPTKHLSRKAISSH